MKKSFIYTCTGDAGTTSLVGGKRVKKNDCRIESYGSVDELNSTLGLLAAMPDISVEYRSLLTFIQNKLFNIGAYLATDNPDGNTSPARGLSIDDITRIEQTIDKIDASLPPLNNFVLPGGSQSAAIAHICRTSCRRAERRIIDLAEISYVDTLVLKFINRLSDFLFVFARFCNINNNTDEIFWNKDC